MSRAQYISTVDVYNAMDELKAGATPAQTVLADYILARLGELKTVPHTDADVGTAPVRRTKTATYHTLYANRRGAVKTKKYTAWLCPVCDWFVGSHRVTHGGEKRKPCNFCTRCGQRIDWADIELGDDYDTPAPIPAAVSSEE